MLFEPKSIMFWNCTVKVFSRASLRGLARILPHKSCGDVSGGVLVWLILLFFQLPDLEKDLMKLNHPDYKSVEEVLDKYEHKVVQCLFVSITYGFQV